MERIDFPGEAARLVEEYDSHGARWSVLPSSGGPARIGLMRFGAGATLGAHPAGLDQLFVVVSGSGWIQTDNEPPEAISEGTAILWRAGEVHASGSNEGMTVVIIQAESFDQIGG